MGILNVTPDSFFENSRYTNVEEAVKRGLEMQKQGADILDIGGESTRPGALPVSEEKELARVIPVLQAIFPQLDIPISIDTRKARVAAAAIELGASMINDISGFSDPEMQEVAASHNVDVCVMHMQNDPQTMQNNPHYFHGVMPELMNWFDKQIGLLIQRGVKEEHVIIDPGIGFGKSVEDNLEIIRNISKLKTLGFPILIGISRKSFMSRILGKKPTELLSATISLNTLLIEQEVDVIRVHDVQEHRDVIDLLYQPLVKISHLDCAKALRVERSQIV